MAFDKRFGPNRPQPAREKTYTDHRIHTWASEYAIFSAQIKLGMGSTPAESKKELAEMASRARNTVYRFMAGLEK